MQRVTTDGESVIAPEVPELIKKQDHTLVQSKEREAVEGGGEDAEPGLRFFTSVSVRFEDSLPSENYKSFLCVYLDSNRRSVLH